MEEQQFWPIAGGEKGVLTFPKGISPKIKLIVWLELELANFDAVVQHYTYVISVCGCKERTKTELQKQIRRHVKILTIVLKTNK